jgi:hypothetical protein
MAELGIITMLAKKPKKKAFTIEQLLEIYEKAGRSVKVEQLRETAHELYPDIVQDGKIPVFVKEGMAGRGFVIDGKLVKPKWTISTHMARSIGILEDGTARGF